MKSVLKLASDLWAEVPRASHIQNAENTIARIHAPSEQEKASCLGGFRRLHFLNRGFAALSPD